MEDTVSVKYIYNNELPTVAIQSVMKLYGYGYTHCVFAEQYENGIEIVVASEHIQVDEATLELIRDYYHGLSEIRHLLDDNGKHITLEEV